MTETGDRTKSAATSVAEDAAALEIGRRLYLGPCVFEFGAASLDALPEADLPEIAFAGRSNVGKSSLLNALTGQNALARTSKTPGRTQQINFFRLGDDRQTLVDLPGYGYARVSKKTVREWTEFVSLYLQGRSSLKRVLLLVDARHGFKDLDRDLLKMMDKAAVSYQIVLTKADCLKPAALADRLAETERESRTHGAAHPEILVTSSKTGNGIPELRASLAKLAQPAKFH